MGNRKKHCTFEPMNLEAAGNVANGAYLDGIPSKQ